MGKLMAIYANCHRESGTTPFMPEDFMWEARYRDPQEEAPVNAEQANELLGMHLRALEKQFQQDAKRQDQLREGRRKALELARQKNNSPPPSAPSSIRTAEKPSQKPFKST